MGDGPERNNLEKLSQDLKIRKHVKFLGSVSHAKAIRLFVGCSFFVLPSRIEPFGIVNLEAMASGKAVIGSCVGGVPEVVQDNVTGFIVLPENAAALSEAISTLTSDSKLREKFGEAGRVRAKNFNWETISEQYEDVYKKVCTGR